MPASNLPFVLYNTDSNAPVSEYYDAGPSMSENRDSDSDTDTDSDCSDHQARMPRIPTNINGSDADDEDSSPSNPTPLSDELPVNWENIDESHFADIDSDETSGTAAAPSSIPPRVARRCIYYDELYTRCRAATEEFGIPPTTHYTEEIWN
ncbi:MAG: hypothetical protein Q9218_008331, partial [Villophora microphyllina]